MNQCTDKEIPDIAGLQAATLHLVKVMGVLAEKALMEGAGEEEEEGDEDKGNDERVDRLDFLEITQRSLDRVVDQKERLAQALQRG